MRRTHVRGGQADARGAMHAARNETTQLICKHAEVPQPPAVCRTRAWKALIRLVEFARSGAAVPIRHFGPAMEDAADERGAELAIAAAREARGNAGRKGNGAADQRRAGEMGGARLAPAKDDRSLSADEADDDDDKRIERRRPAPQNQRDQRRDRRNREDEGDPDWRPRSDKCRSCLTRG